MNMPVTTSQALTPSLNGDARGPTVAAVMTSFNKRDDVRANLTAIAAQTVPFAAVIVVDNCSKAGPAAMIRAEFPWVELIEMPHDRFGACETFNIGFGAARADFIAILDDDVVLPPGWNERMLAKFRAEPPSTALISSNVVEPGTPQWYLDHPLVNRERYMATFRGCASLVRRDVLMACGGYDADFFIYGNERDLSARILNAGWRILQYPGVQVAHGTPFGMKHGRRSLYYHVRNLWWYLFKHVPVSGIIAFLWSQAARVFRRDDPLRADAVGTIGVFKVIRDTPGGMTTVIKATWDGFCGLPRCLKKRAPCRAPDFRLPVS